VTLYGTFSDDQGSLIAATALIGCTVTALAVGTDLDLS